MTGPDSCSAEDIEKSAAVLRQLRPAYNDILDFYTRIFVVQENFRPSIHVEAAPIPEDLLALKLKEGFPLVDRSEFVIEKRVSIDLLKTICRIAKDAGHKLSVSAEKLMRGMETGRLDVALLFKSYMAEDTGYLKNTAEGINVESEVLAFFIYNSIKPFLVCNARKLSRKLSLEDGYAAGFCPICGSMPDLASFEDDGRRYVFCSFCCYKWRVQRLLCVFCGNADHRSLGYFYSEEEPEYRVDTCSNCKRYIKTVDARNLNRPLCPDLEKVGTLHLDIKAREDGFEGPVPQEF